MKNLYSKNSSKNKIDKKKSEKLDAFFVFKTGLGFLVFCLLSLISILKKMDINMLTKSFAEYIEAATIIEMMYAAFLLVTIAGVIFSSYLAVIGGKELIMEKIIKKYGEEKYALVINNDINLSYSFKKRHKYTIKIFSKKDVSSFYDSSKTIISERGIYMKGDILVIKKLKEKIVIVGKADEYNLSEYLKNEIITYCEKSYILNDLFLDYLNKQNNDIIASSQNKDMHYIKKEDLLKEYNIKI